MASSLVITVLLAACGGRETPTRPGPVATPDTGFPAGTVLSFVSGDTNTPVPGALVRVGGVAYTTDGQGEVRLSERAEPQALIDVIAAGWFDRHTVLRVASETRFTLWPRGSPSGFNEHYTATLVYTETVDDAPIGQRPLRRIQTGQTRAVVVLSPELWADPAALAAHEDAVRHVNSVLEGTVVYRLAAEAPASGVVFTASLDPLDEGCAMPRRLATFYGRSVSFGMTGGHIAYCTAAASRSAVATHELGHSMGLAHSPEAQDRMFRFFSTRQVEGFNALEGLAVRLSMQRRPGTRFPDNDRLTTASSGTGTTRITCP